MAERARRSVQGDVEPINQSVIVSGESGAGKVGQHYNFIKDLVTFYNVNFHLIYQCLV